MKLRVKNGRVFTEENGFTHEIGLNQLSIYGSNNYGVVLPDTKVMIRNSKVLSDGEKDISPDRASGGKVTTTLNDLLAEISTVKNLVVPITFEDFMKAHANLTVKALTPPEPEQEPIAEPTADPLTQNRNIDSAGL